MLPPCTGSSPGSRSYHRFQFPKSDSAIQSDIFISYLYWISCTHLTPRRISLTDHLHMNSVRGMTPVGFLLPCELYVFLSLCSCIGPDYCTIFVRSNATGISGFGLSNVPLPQPSPSRSLTLFLHSQTIKTKQSINDMTFCLKPLQM